jgi:hypothetical protein
MGAGQDNRNPMPLPNWAFLRHTTWTKICVPIAQVADDPATPIKVSNSVPQWIRRTKRTGSGRRYVLGSDPQRARFMKKRSNHRHWVPWVRVGLKAGACEVRDTCSPRRNSQGRTLPTEVESRLAAPHQIELQQCGPLPARSHCQGPARIPS